MNAKDFTNRMNTGGGRIRSSGAAKTFTDAGFGSARKQKVPAQPTKMAQPLGGRFKGSFNDGSYPKKLPSEGISNTFQRMANAGGRDTTKGRDIKKTFGRVPK